ncbi:RHS repeat-associated core domain-containing protein, partial [Paenibacillus wenxiniae]
NGTSATYTYDERGQQTSATLKATSSNTLASGTMQVKSIFGSGGNILTDRHELYINDAKVATQTSTSDKLDRVTSLSSIATDYAARLDASYDPLDRVASQTSTLNGTSFLTNYGYDKSRLVQIQTNGAQTRTTAATANVNYAYTPSGQVQRITFPTLSDGTTLQENMTYDLMNRLTRVSNTKGESTLSVYSYQYDNNGNIISVTEQVKDGTLQTSTYSYDKLSRLTGVKRADGTETQYSYDLRGNRLTQKDTRDLPDEKAANYRYDLQNTLISVTKDSVKTALNYLPDGLRWKKTNGSQVTQYSYNGADQVIGDQTSNGTISSYIRGDRVLVKKDLTNQKDYYYLYNGHGDVVQMVGTDGSLVNSYQYDEWGNLTQQKETVANEFKYAGETYDAETGLYYLKARYYDPSMGRFINEDTVEGKISNPLSSNLYTYVENKPVNMIDPTGNMGQMVCSQSDEACHAKAEFNRQLQIARADQLFETIGDYVNTSIDNLNAFGPAGSTANVTLKSLGYGLKYASGILKAVFAEKTTMKILNLGSGSSPIEGVVNIDIKSGKGVDLVADVTKALPYASQSVDAMIARNPYGYAPVNSFTTDALKPGGTFTLTGTYSNAFFKEYYDATVEQLQTLGYKILYRGEAQGAYKYNNFQSNGKSIKPEAMKQITLEKLGG